jgi:signal transduction histidine kinase/ActR/RegA family two-component response regulator
LNSSTPERTGTQRSIAVRYALAVTAMLIAAGVRWGLERLAGPMPPFIVFYPAVLAVAVLAGVGPAMVSIVASALLADVWLMPPLGSLAVARPADLISLALFCGTSLVLCALVERLRRAQASEARALRESERAAAAARAEQERLSLVLANIGEEVYFTDTQRRYIFANAAALREFNMNSMQDVDVATMVSTLTVLRADGTPRPLEEAPPLRSLAGEVVRDEEHIVKTPRTGQWRHRQVSSVPVRDASGAIIGAVSVVRDITDRKRSEAALREADERKNGFLATLSHELRNPLAPIRAAAQLLVEPGLSAQDLSRCRDIISRQVAHMASLLDDLLDVSRLTRGELTLRKSRVPLQQILDAALETAQPLITAKRHRLRFELPDEPVLLEVDPVRLTQVLCNLLTNAAKYTDPEGEITVGASVHEDELRLTVRDTGIGLPADTFATVFEMFVQVEPATAHTQGGLGIGLALVKALVELHGGHVEVHSEGHNRGSRFTVSLPHSVLAASGELPASVPPPQPPPAHRARRVLIADDNADAVETLGMLLSVSGHEVHLASDGARALEIAARERPEVVMLDIGMPGLSGYEVAQRIRAEPWGAGMILIALTGWGQEEDKRRAREAGFDHHLTKPADPAEIERLLASARSDTTTLAADV